MTEIPNSIHKASASLNVDDMPSPLSTTAIFDWQNKNLPNLHDQTGATTDNTRHKGLKAHLGGAFSVIGSSVGTVANAYVPIANTGMKLAEPKITVEAGHCPAANDPAFQVPVTWWSDLSKEENSAMLGPQWTFWLTAVQNVFSAHAHELHETPGVASLHVMINPTVPF